MLGEVSVDLGQQLTATELVPLLPPLVKDGESIIRQRLCHEIKILCLVLMGLTKRVDLQHHFDYSTTSGEEGGINRRNRH